MVERRKRGAHPAVLSRGPRKVARRRDAPWLAAAAGLLLLIAALPCWAQLSPGPLSKAHTSLSGMTQCGECHSLGKGGGQLKCAGCHVEIRERVAAGHGYHATVAQKGADGKACVTCHSEHNGTDFQLVHWLPSLEKFDHIKTGYVLEGKHAALKCRDCHNPKKIPMAERRTLGVQDPNHTYLGLAKDCLSCHEDTHHGQLDKNCLSCHVMTGWKGAQKFNHANTQYPLTGAHEKLACLKCHRTVEAAPAAFVKYTGIPSSDCTACHKDPHAGKFQGACRDCHVTTSWRQVRGLAEFDHSKTKFPLVGKHQGLRCENCHRQADFKFPGPHMLCADCHTDPHHGQFLARKAAGACSECHNELGWKPALFTVAMHQETTYPLQGRHLQVACGKCHLPRGAETVYVIKQTNCASCHQDVHHGQFAGPPHQNRCEDCHTLETFRMAQFTLEQHQRTRFPLVGAHIAVACDGCHKADPAAGLDAPAKYQFEDRTCTACHTDPHRGEFAQRMALRRKDGSEAGCLACHTQNAWKPLAGFDHASTRFPLVGAHQAVECAACHRPANLETSLKNVDFRKAPMVCHECHEDAHGGQFSKAGKAPSCDGCHNLFKWRPSTFNHEMQSDFSLKGAHESVPCRQCHTLYKELNGQRVLFYKPTARECSACHN